MRASEICGLVDSSGISALSRAFAISRRQAEQFERQARRALAAGADPVMVPGDAAGTVRAAQRPQEPLEVPVVDPEGEAQARAAHIRGLSPGHRIAPEGDIAARVAVLERNILQGYTEWKPELHQLRRVQELLGL